MADKIISYRLCFTKNTFNGEMVCDFVRDHEKHLGFIPSKIVFTSAGIYTAKVITDKILKKIANVKENISLTILDDSEAISFNITNTAKRESCQSVTLSAPIEKYAVFDSVLDSFISNENFIIGYGYDSEFVRWQSEIYPSHYKIFEKPMVGVKLYWNKFFNEEQIDIKANPARMTLVKGMWLSVSPIMYFGREMFHYISASELLRYKAAKSVAKINENVIKVILFDNLSESDKQDNYQKLQDFRKYFSIDELEAMLA
ncbi:hypothetical protein [Lacibacter sediminis]|uniref:Uncharacterized protein n=1 Tax=Lacibacter sediminis TaxID=2760713 RepID=A0A7G5XCQ6_9BACT|nr:hypothetical protein [Lacibacter sediminis]QNA43259.1 hypothetical protein H4075_14365 [Lacibacter sediminis]